MLGCVQGEDDINGPSTTNNPRVIVRSLTEKSLQKYNLPL